MEIKKEVTVKLSPEDVQQIIKEHLKKTQNIDVTSVYFDVNGHEHEGDYFAQQSLDYRLDEVICKAQEV